LAKYQSKQHDIDSIANHKKKLAEQVLEVESRKKEAELKKQAVANELQDAEANLKTKLAEIGNETEKVQDNTYTVFVYTRARANILKNKHTHTHMHANARAHDVSVCTHIYVCVFVHIRLYTPGGSSEEDAGDIQNKSGRGACQYKGQAKGRGRSFCIRE